MTEISYVNLSAQWENEREDLIPVIESVLASGQYVGGEEVEKFEHEASSTFGVNYVVAVNSGTDALMFGLAALGIGPGDEVITAPNSFIASTASITLLGGVPVFVDVCPDQNIDATMIEEAITPRTKAIMPIHLTGRMAAMEAILKLAAQHNLAVIEDAAQSAGSMLCGRPSGSWGDIGCFSAHPLKNLNACGDAGFITTQNSDIARKVSLMRNHGLVDRDTVSSFGKVSRMDTIQAAILRFRLKTLSKTIERRRSNVEFYRSILDQEVVFHPPDKPDEFNSWHTFVIQVDRRDELRNYLSSQNIETAIHYRVPIHLQPASQILGYTCGDFKVAERQAERILTLPVNQYLAEVEISKVADTINRFFRS